MSEYLGSAPIERIIVFGVILVGIYIVIKRRGRK